MANAAPTGLITPSCFLCEVTYREGEQSPAQWVRAVLEGQFLNMRLHSQWLGIAPQRIRLTAGASRNNGIAQVIANVFAVPVDRLETTKSAGLGAAIRVASACGESLEALESDFCNVDEAFTLSPESGAAGVYDGMLAAYSEFLAGNG